MMELYKINETMQHSYYQMPQELFDNEKYKQMKQNMYEQINKII